MAYTYMYICPYVEIFDNVVTTLVDEHENRANRILILWKHKPMVLIAAKKPPDLQSF